MSIEKNFIQLMLLLIITVLDALCSIVSSCKSLTEITIRNTFKQARFTRPTYDKSTSTKATFNNEILPPENTCFHQLAQPFTHHLTIAENIMSAEEFMVSVSQLFLLLQPEILNNFILSYCRVLMMMFQHSMHRMKIVRRFYLFRKYQMSSSRYNNSTSTITLSSN